MVARFAGLAGFRSERGRPPVMQLIRSARRLASAAKHEVFPAPEVAAWRTACRAADLAPRHTAGMIDMMGYRLRYSDLLTFCPQWHDIFVARSLSFAPPTPS